MERPTDISRPFFAYGLFRPGQLAFFQLRELVREISDPARVAGSLRLRDGLPIIDPAGPGFVRGVLLTFRPNQAAEAYNRVSAMEPDKHYRWHEAEVEGTPANVLVGRSPRKGSDPCDDAEWNGWDDPLFKEALEVVGEEANQWRDCMGDLKALFRLQMAYLLLWSAIERYVSLRYHLGDKVTAKISHLAGEQAFVAGLVQHVKESRKIYRADRPDEAEKLDPQFAEGSLNYYFQVRCNIAHRGKAVAVDHVLLSQSLTELLAIFRDVLKEAEREAGSSAM